MAVTELSFLLELLLEHKLTKPTQTAIKDRIKEIEAAPATFIAPRAAPIHAQQPSTQALLAKQEAAIAQAEANGLVTPPPTLAALPRMVGGEVITGNGLKGPRKF